VYSHQLLLLGPLACCLQLARHLLLNVVNTLLVLGVTAHQRLHRLLLFRAPLPTSQPTVSTQYTPAQLPKPAHLQCCCGVCSLLVGPSLTHPATAWLQVWHTMLLVLLADLLVQLASMAPKLLLVAALKGKAGGGSPRNQQRQARLLTCFEYLVSSYRALLPVRVW
jgi:hypothetical protein